MSLSSPGFADMAEKGELGTEFWDTPILTFLRLDNVASITQYIPNKGLNEAFMAFGGVALAFNIIVRCGSCATTANEPT